MPLVPHIDMAGAPMWLRITMAACLLTEAAFLLLGAWALWQRSRG